MRNIIDKIQEILINPLKEVSDLPTLRKTRLLTFAILLLLVFNIVFSLIPEALGITSFGMLGLSIVFTLLLFVTYVISRYGFVTLSTSAIILAFSAAVFYMSYQIGDTDILPYIVIPLLIGSMLLDLKYMRWVFYTILAMAVIFPVFIEGLTIKDFLFGFISYLVMIEGLVYLVTWNRERIEELHIVNVKRRENFLKAIVSNVDEALITINRHGKIKFWNPSAERMYGYSQKEVLGKDISEFINEKFIEMHSRMVERYVNSNFKSNEVEQMRMEEESRKGKKIILEVSAAAWSIEKKMYITAILHDITKQIEIENRFIRKKEEAEKLALESSKHLQLVEEKNVQLERTKKAMLNLLEDIEEDKAIVEREKARSDSILLAIGEGVVVTDRKDRILLVNDAFEEMLGWKRGEVKGKSFVELIPMQNEKGKDVPVKERMKHLLLYEGKDINESNGRYLTRTSSVKPYYYIRKDGSRFPVNITKTPIVMGRDNVGTVEVFRDITREREIDKAKTEFVSIASHQLRTPLSTIGWYTEMLVSEDAGRLNSDQKSYLKEIYIGNKRMIKLVNALLNVSRIEMGTFGVAPVEIDITKLADDVVREFLPLVKKKGISFDKEYAKDIPKIKLDTKLTRIVFQNILSNAVKYTPKGGKVTLDIRMGDDSKGTVKERQLSKNVIIKISDTGCGIPEKQKDKIFTKLFRADNVKEIDPDGTGLGLYIVKSIVDNARGKIWFESEENKGTTFFVAIPITGMKKQEGTKSLIGG